MEPFDHLSNLCADVVSEKRHEPLLLSLFRDTPAGEWVPLRELAGSGEYPFTLAASWVKTPDAEYAMVLFFDSETLWSMHADYNLSRLLRSNARSVVAASA